MKHPIDQAKRAQELGQALMAVIDSQDWTLPEIGAALSILLGNVGVRLGHSRERFTTNMARTYDRACEQLMGRLGAPAQAKVDPELN